MALKKGKPLPPRSQLSFLHYVINENVGVGGRLSKALVPEKTKQSLILDLMSQVTQLIRAHYHRRLLCKCQPRLE